MKRLLTAWVLMTFLPGAAPVTTAASTNRGVRIIKIKFDPHCDEEASRECRNRELIVVRNDSDEVKRLKGWTIHDLRRDFVYKVPYRTRVKPGERMILYSGRGQDLAGSSINGESHTTYYYHWDRRRPVWDNTRDRATLERPDGSVADRCGYGRAAASPKRC